MKRTIRLALPALALGLLAACATPSQTRLPDGTVAFRVDCDGAASGMNYCFERAGKSCGAAGYTVVDRDGRSLSSEDANMETLFKAYATDKSSILVRCGG